MEEDLEEPVEVKPYSEDSSYFGQSSGEEKNDEPIELLENNDAAININP